MVVFVSIGFVFDVVIGVSTLVNVISSVPVAVVVGGPSGHFGMQVSHFVYFLLESTAVAHQKYLFCQEMHQFVSSFESDNSINLVIYL